MKHFKLFSLLLCGLAAMAFTSCLNDDDDNKLTPAEIQQAYLAVAGNHNGKVVFQATNPKNSADKLDTLAASWNVTSDSTMTIYNVPISKLAPYINDDNLKAAIAQLPNATVQCFIGFTQLSPVTFLVNPNTLTYENLNYNGGTHKVQIGFYTSNYNSYGAYNASSRMMGVQIIIGGIFIDGVYNSTLLTESFPMVFRTDL
ncbi:MAG: DUF4840 domain-containing protein [Prevotella sp.]|nr:DUF4840 domain-containing protein [Prevotella sp.]